MGAVNFRNKSAKKSFGLQKYVGKKKLPVNSDLGLDRRNSFPSPFLYSNILVAFPAHAAGKIFDFDATLPFMAAQFLILMVFLDKVWFGPVGKVMSDRNRKIAAGKESLMTGTEELTSLQKEAEKILKDARIEAKAKIADARTTSNEKAEAELQAEKALIDAEIAAAVNELSTERASAQKDIDLQVSELSQYIIKKV